MPTRRTGVTPERLALAARAAELRQNGLTIVEVAERLGRSRSYTAQLLSDPTGEKDRARKDSYGGVCSLCGRRTSGSDGPGTASDVCGLCSVALQSENRFWTPEQIVASFKEFEAATGRQPTAFERSVPPSVLKRLSPERRAEREAEKHLSSRLPVTSTVVREFGSWKGALRAAGMEVRAGGSPHHRGFMRTNATLDTLSLLSLGPMTTSELAEARGVGPNSSLISLRRLVGLGLAEQVGKGRYGSFLYALTEKGEEEMRRMENG